MSVKGYKAMNSDGTCKNFKFKVGKIYTTDESIKLCSTGFHFCENAFDVYNYYPKSEDTIICEVEALGEVLREGDKSVTNKIKIIKQLTERELLILWIKRTNSGYYNSGDRNSGNYNSGNYNSGDRNSGHYNSGHYNSGDYNSGHHNSGDCNSGDRNSGHRNSGHYNSGDYNSGNYNSGNYNSGNYNSGHYNSGDRNSGDRNSGHYNSGYYNSGDRNSGNYNSGHYNSGNYNSGDRNSGYFNTTISKVKLFNKDSNLNFDSPEVTKLKTLNVKPILSWIHTNNMTEEEKKAYPSHKTTGGFLRNSGKMSWNALTKEDLEFIKSLPNFDAQIFKEISGLDLSKPKTVTVTVDDQNFEIDIDKAKELGLIK